MKIVLLALDREPERATRILRDAHPQAEIAVLPLAKIESATAWQRLRALRVAAPDVFAVSTENIAWQQGQNSLLLFGALGGARQVILFDPRGARRAENRGSILLRTAFRFAREAWISWKTNRQGRSAMARLTREVAQDGNLEAKAIDNPAAPRITYLRTTPAAGTYSGGATTHTIGFIHGAVESGARVAVISNDQIAGLDQTKVDLKIIEPDSLGLTRSAFDLRNGMLFTERAAGEIENEPPDFIYQRYSRLNWSGVDASLRVRRPLFLEYNGSEVWMAKHWGRLRALDLLEQCEQLNLRAATRIFVVAEIERRNLIKAGVPPERIVVNPNAVDVEKFRPGVGGEPVRRELGINATEVVAGFVGTFGPWHGVLTLAECITMLPPDCRVRFLLIGAGKYREAVEEMVSAAGRSSQVIFTGQVEHHLVPPLLDACDILLSPHVPLEDGSDFFGSPTKLFEYMAMGKGIIASRLGQIGNVLAHEETALLVEPANVPELSAAIERLADSAELRARLGAAARRGAVERHTWKQNAQRVFDAYGELVD
jgi:glycosyltransferase involved in cell wall biosynthesis